MPGIDYTQWHNVGYGGVQYRERFDPEALAGVDTSAAFRFKVIRETWDETVDPPERTIHEVELLDA